MQFTKPVAIGVRRWNGNVTTSVGAFVVLDSAGWILTANHVFAIGEKAVADEPSVSALNAEISAVKADPSLKPKYRARELGRLHAKADPQWITHHAYWWSRDGVEVAELHQVPEADLAIARLDPFPADFVSAYPILKSPVQNMDSGTSLCRLGFPFNSLTAAFDATTGEFSAASGQLVFFPIEGMFTRRHLSGRTPDGKHPLLKLETSSPGLMGQSGGPIFDVHGRVWAIQSSTYHVPLGFNPPDPTGKGGTIPQFLNLGVGVHVETIISVLDDLGIAYQVSPD